MLLPYGIAVCTALHRRPIKISIRNSLSRAANQPQCAPSPGEAAARDASFAFAGHACSSASLPRRALYEVPESPYRRSVVDDVLGCLNAYMSRDAEIRGEQK